MIRALDTRYGGCVFRSRLEARWAVFFDHWKIQWEYEPQGYAGDGWSYLPDFYLPTVKGGSTTARRAAHWPGPGVYFEVKPESAGDRPWIMWSDFVQGIGKPLVVAFGIRADGPMMIALPHPVAADWQEDRWTPAHEARWAYDAANSARFEHGQGGAYIGPGLTVNGTPVCPHKGLRARYCGC